MRPTPLLLAVLALPLLAACNQVYTRQPLIGEARQQGDPEFRPGLWKVGTDADDPTNCPFDIRKSRRDWPACAGGVEIKRGEMFLIGPHDRGEAASYRLLDGQPILLQAHLHTDILKDPRVPEPKDADNPMTGWVYAGITVLRTDAAARITEAQLVWADCGPVPAKTAGVTNRPFAGLTIVKTNCVAADLDAVKTAIAGSARLNPPQPMRWIRDTP